MMPTIRLFPTSNSTIDGVTSLGDGSIGPPHDPASAYTDNDIPVSTVMSEGATYGNLFSTWKDASGNTLDSLVSSGATINSVTPVAQWKTADGAETKFRFTPVIGGTVKDPIITPVYSDASYTDRSLAYRYRNIVQAESGLVSVWPLNETSGTNADDPFGGNDGTFTGTYALNSTALVANEADGSLSVSGAGYVVATTLGTTGANLGSGFTLECRMATNSTARHCLMGTVNTGTSMVVQWFINTTSSSDTATGRIFLQVRGSDGKSITAYVNADTGITDGAAHALAVTVVPSTNTVTFYVDGTAKTTTYTTQGTPATFANFGYAMAIGARNLRGTLDNVYSGKIADAALYLGALSLSRIQAHAAFAGVTRADLLIAAFAMRLELLCTADGKADIDFVAVDVDYTLPLGAYYYAMNQ